MASRPALREKLRDRQSGLCCYCRAPMAPPTSNSSSKKPAAISETLEHLQRIIDGGTNRHDNMALACFECNTGRGAIDWLTYTSYRRGEIA